ncbi:MAG: CcmD family protein [Bacteroidetes bacterium]|nr:CcmD family protein [Bacteroidota bacterium]
MFKSIFKKILLFVFYLGSVSNLFAQEKVEMADGMRSNGKIYVVVVVIAVVLAGLFLFLANIDRKLTRLERERQKQ